MSVSFTALRCVFIAMSTPAGAGAHASARGMHGGGGARHAAETSGCTGARAATAHAEHRQSRQPAWRHRNKGARARRPRTVACCKFCSSAARQLPAHILSTRAAVLHVLARNPAAMAVPRQTAKGDVARSGPARLRCTAPRRTAAARRSPPSFSHRESVAHARRDGCLYVGGTVVLCEIAQPTWAHTSARAAGKAAKLSRRYP